MKLYSLSTAKLTDRNHRQAYSIYTHRETQRYRNNDD